MISSLKYRLFLSVPIILMKLDWLATTILQVSVKKQIFPVLTPLAVDPSHPFPYISNLSLNLAVMVRDPQDNRRRFARVKIPPVLPRFVEVVEGERFVPIEQVVAAPSKRNPPSG